jgi:hypothetical protein
MIVMVMVMVMVVELAMGAVGGVVVVMLSMPLGLAHTSSLARYMILTRLDYSSVSICRWCWW